MKKFSIGNEVRLKSGGPRMTIEEILPNNLIVCTYIHHFVEHKKEVFEADKLELADRIKYCPRTLID